LTGEEGVKINAYTPSPKKRERNGITEKEHNARGVNLKPRERGAKGAPIRKGGVNVDKGR